MKVDKSLIPIYDWSLIILRVERPKDAKRVVRYLQKIGLPDDEILEFKNNILNNHTDGGEHIFHSLKRKSIILFYKMSNLQTLLRVAGHEKRHMEDAILRTCSVEDTEAAAYLAGYLTNLIFNIFLL